MSNLKVGDYVTCRGMLGIQIFAKVKAVEDHDTYPCYVIDGPEGEFKSYGAELLTKKAAKEWVSRLESSVKFLKTV